MAVYQISRIQVRRGQMQAGTGLPQLASGELAWAIDTQELYIGNGATAEGAPEIGNTKIITEHDNIFDIYQYQYKANFKDLNTGTNTIQTGTTPYLPVMQAVSDVLDRIVWAEDFGIASTTHALANVPETQSRFRVQFQRAINELFLNPKLENLDTDDVDFGGLQKDYRVELKFTPGLYVFDQTIYVPSYVKITGAGVDRTFFVYTGEGNAFEFVNEGARDYINDNNGQFYEQIPNTTLMFADFLESVQNEATETTQPKFVNLNNFTLLTKDSVANGFLFQNVRNSDFSDIRVVGPWTTTSPELTYGLKFTASETDTDITCSTNKFNRITVTGFHTGVYSAYSIRENLFDQCRIEGKRESVGTAARNIKNGFVFGETGALTPLLGPRDNIISNSTFEYVDQHGIHVKNGLGNKTRGNTYTNVGEDEDGVPVFSHVKFDVPGNSTLHDTFDRYNDLVDTTFSVTKPYVPEVEGIVYHQALVTKQKALSAASGQVARFPLNATTSYKIDYIYQSDMEMRKGTLNVAVDLVNERVQLTDEYECTNVELYDPDVVPSQYAQDNEALIFTAVLNPQGELEIHYENDTIDLDGFLTFTYTILIHS